MLIEAKSNFLELKMVKGYNRDKKIVEDIEVKKQVRLQIGEGIAGLALEKGKLIVADQGFQEATFKKYGSMIDSTVKYLVCAPLIVNNHKIGVINLSHGEHVSPLSEDELEFLNICAHQIAVTIENSRIFDSAITDSMTDLFNYRYFLSRIANEMRRVTRRKTSLSLLYIAIDNYDSLIGLHGTTKIETLVADLSACLRDTLRSTDIAARVKGNEFVALLPETDSAGARITAHKIIKAIADSRFGDQEGMISATVSIGIAVFPTDSQGTTDLIRLAEFALQKAQARGPSSIMGFAPRPPKT
jgi:diguanylate cyclase (GGDEF)-like protein